MFTECVCVCLCVCDQNQLKDKSVIQLYSKSSGVYLGLQSGGNVVGMKNPDNDSSEFIHVHVSAIHNCKNHSSE